MHICYIGNYDANYARHKLIIKGLKRNGVEVNECNFAEKDWRKYLRLFGLRKEMAKADIVYVAYSDSRYAWFVKLITRKPVFWDAFYSLWDNWVFDRNLAKPGSLKARYLWFLDYICAQLADVVILDTAANCDFFVKTFHLKKEKMLAVLIGADNDILKPLARPAHDGFIVEFHGNYIPVQGVEYIVRAAKLLENEDIRFKLIGKGQTKAAAIALAQELETKNVEFIDAVPFAELQGYLAEADLTLGLLGSVDRARRSIPNKVYEASAMKRLSINIASPAVDEAYVAGRDILTVEAGNVDDLVAKIRWAKANPEKLREMEEAAYRVYLEYGVPEKLVLPLIAAIKQRIA